MTVVVVMMRAVDLTEVDGCHLFVPIAAKRVELGTDDDKNNGNQ